MTRFTRECRGVIGGHWSPVEIEDALELLSKDCGRVVKVEVTGMVACSECINIAIHFDSAPKFLFSVFSTV